MIVVAIKYHFFFFVLKLLKSTQLPAKSKRLKSQKIAPKSCSNINATATADEYQHDKTAPNELKSQLSNSEQPELTALDRKLKVERLAKSSIMLNFLLDSNNNNSLRLHESKSCGYVKHGLHDQQNHEDYVVEEDELLLANNKEWPEDIPDIDDETTQNLLMFNDKQLVTEEQFNQAFILNVSCFLFAFKFKKK
jgi:hypothetical protein